MFKKNKITHIENPKSTEIFVEYNGKKVTYEEMTKVLEVIENLNLNVESNGELGFRHDKTLYNLSL